MSSLVRPRILSAKDRSLSAAIMRFEMLFFVVLSALEMVRCQQPLDDLSEITPYIPSENLQKKLLQQCESFAQNLSEENERLKNEVDVLKIKIEAMEEIEDEDDEEDEEEDDEGKYNSNESEEPTRGLRHRRGTAARCEGGTLSAWACAPQCIFKLKGLCGLSLKSICHC